MVNRSIPLAYGEFFHVYNRGADKRVIYKDRADYSRFLELLYIANSRDAVTIKDFKKQHPVLFEIERGEPLVAIGGYCLMPNHFHIILTPLVEHGASKFMQKVSTGYSMYFNNRYERTGTLFEGKFKAQHAGRDEYLKYLFAYIHLNPVKLIQSNWKQKGIKDAIQALSYSGSYQYSSLPDYLGMQRPERAIISPDPFPAYFLTAAGNAQNLLEWLNYPEVGPRDK